MTPPDARLPRLSALIKLVAVRAESGALRRELRNWPQRISSVLGRIVVTRAADRPGAARPRWARVLADVDLLAIDAIAPAASQIGGGLLRSLDAIHLATAANIAAELGALITYDRRMITEAIDLGLPVLTPVTNDPDCTDEDQSDPVIFASWGSTSPHLDWSVHEAVERARSRRGGGSHRIPR